MKNEVVRTGRLQGDRSVRPSVTIKGGQNTIVITANNFDPKVLSKRPDGWSDLRIKRVMLKEHIDRIAGLEEEVLLEMRNDRELEEEVTMIDEVETYGKVLSLADMTTEKAVVAIVPTSQNFNALDPEIRPEGWDKVKKKRVMIQEHLDRLAGIDEETLDDMHNEREEAEEAKMVSEVATVGKVTVNASAIIAGEADVVTARSSMVVGSHAGAAQIQIDLTTFDAKQPQVRPPGWREVQKKRITKREQIDRLRGIPEEVIVEKRRERDQHVSSLATEQ